MDSNDTYLRNFKVKYIERSWTIFCQPKKFQSLKITTYKSVYSNKDKIGF